MDLRLDLDSQEALVLAEVMSKMGTSLSGASVQQIPMPRVLQISTQRAQCKA